MKIREAANLVNVTLPSGNAKTRRLAGCHTVGDFERAARRLLPRSVFDYVDGGADDEFSLRANTAAIRQWRFNPDVLNDVSNTSTAAEILGRAASAPFGLAPTGYTRMLSPLGEPSAAQAAGRAGLPYVLSTMATTSLEDLESSAADTDRWFQLYIWKNRELTSQLIDRAAASGFRVLEVAVDTAVSGRRIRDVRNGFTIPPQLTLKSMMDIGTKPGYWLALMRNPMIEFANVSGNEGASDGYTIENISQQFDASVTWEDLTAIREQWNGALVLKGPIGSADALRARDLGIDAVHLSNHGGRQLDRTIAPIDLVRPVRESVGPDMGIFVDSGIRHGADIATAIALGADAAFVGRAYLYGLIVGGGEGVDRVLSLLKAELLRTMQLLGVQSIAELRAEGARLLSRV